MTTFTIQLPLWFHVHFPASNTVIFNSHQPEHDSGKQAREKAKTHVKLTRNFNCKFYLTFYLYFHSFLGFQEFFLGLKQSLVNAQEKETSGKKRKSRRDKKRWHCAITVVHDYCKHLGDSFCSQPDKGKWEGEKTLFH